MFAGGKSDAEILGMAIPKMDAIEIPVVNERLGTTEEGIIATMNRVFDLLDKGVIDKSSADPMIACARVALAAIKSRDDKHEISRLQGMLAQAKAVSDEGLQHEASMRHHTEKSKSNK